MKIKPEKAIDFAGEYLKAFIRLNGKISHTNKIIKVLINSLYLIILAHLITKLL